MKKLSLVVALCSAVVAPVILPSHIVRLENCAQAAPGKVLLRLRLKPGQRYVMRLQQRQHNRSEWDGPKSPDVKPVAAAARRLLRGSHSAKQSCMT